MSATLGAIYQSSNNTGGTATFPVAATFLAGDMAIAFAKVSSGETVTVSDSVNGSSGWVKQAGPLTVGAGDLYIYTRVGMAAGSPNIILGTNVSDSFQALATVPCTGSGGVDGIGALTLATSGNSRTSGSATPTTSGIMLAFCYNDSNNNGGAVGAGFTALTGIGVTSSKFWNFGIANNFALAEGKVYVSGSQQATFDFTANNTSTTGVGMILLSDSGGIATAPIAWISA